uniref:Protein cereblon n=1 Tax=Physcomitrium patens TaxID=3218 RepID=A0A7I4AY02_PHYPA|nr:protein cereblon-like isoform X4 [Physcomitrium patens]|eukprot:XP_024396736.1 protein cereblon-like isoform X4 [Physcomitrella patens]
MMIPEVDDVASSRSFADGGAFLVLPMFYLEGIVLFPEDTLPLRVLQPRFKAAVDRAMKSTDAPNTLGVIHVRARDGQVTVASVGTTAEIRQLRNLNDGSVNVVTKGRQRFRICKAWTEADGALFAQVQIIEEETPLHIPRDAFSSLATVPTFQSGKVPRAAATSPLPYELSDDEAALQAGSDLDAFDDSETDSGPEDERLAENEDLLRVLVRDVGDDDSSEEEERPRHDWRTRRVRRRGEENGGLEVEIYRGAESVVMGDVLPVDRMDALLSNADQTMHGGESSGGQVAGVKRPREGGWGAACKAWATDAGKWRHRAQCTPWPHWVYRQFDAYDLARRAADMLRQMAELPRMETMVHTPSQLSYYIASNMPLQDSTRQELLEVDGTVYRLRREIELLESMDQLRCKCCMAPIARRSDMLVMSADGPISAYVNAHGFVHETLTLARARGLMLNGQPNTANSWFPGYAWVLAECAECTEHMGWRFTAVDKESRPKAFWGIRRSQLAENSS